ncbi:MAG: phosphoglucosamine mutase [Bacteroidales bacterium]|nr:phosphoglucosamine mutase [Bacteroidales bacterium]MBQ9312000.1 phosphoglucosamine mutase [Bacteroidales bacterium]
MSLIKSISGFRGEIGGKSGNNLTPVDLVGFVSAFAQFIKEKTGKEHISILIGRDARISGEMVTHLVTGTLMAMGVDVLDTGLSTTPTTEVAVVDNKADGGIILTASHNPVQWNALKFLAANGEFISKKDGERVLELAAENDFTFAEVKNLGKYTKIEDAVKKHIDKVLALPLVDVEAIKKADFRIAYDSVNSTGGFVLRMLLEALGVKNIFALNEEPTGLFAHNPEPLPENIKDICDLVEKEHCHVGFVVDPDVDRLALVTETGKPFVEEYTLVAVADYVLSCTPGNTVSNLSSSRALRDITEKKYNMQYSASAVGEVNVIEKMKETNAVIGGEGNGGVIYPECHYGRDALVGIALFLTLLAKKGMKCSDLRDTYPNYVIAKKKMELTPEINMDMILSSIAEKYKNYDVVTIDGVKINFENEWVHLRKSNTEPILRVYAESNTMTTAEHLANVIIEDITTIIRENL